MWIEIIGGEEATDHIRPEVGGRLVKVPIAKPAIVDSPSNGTEGGKLGDIAPELIKCIPRPFSAVMQQALKQRSGVHRAGAGAAQAFNFDPLILQQAVEYTPSVGAMCAATL